MTDWKAIAHRGELSLIVLTRAAAMRKLALFVHIDDETVLASILIPDGSDSATPLQHLSADAARRFIQEMQPHTLDVVGDRGEDVGALSAVLHAALASRPSEVSLH
jgi:hypothetical protein